MQRQGYSREFKERVVEEATVVGNCSQVARKYGLHPGVVSRWVREQKKRQTSGKKHQLSAEKLVAKIKEEIATENSIMERVRVARKYISQGYSIQNVLEAVDMRKSTYYYRLKNPPKKGREYKGGRPIPGYSYNQAGQVVNDEEIKSWLLELKKREKQIGYRQLTHLLKTEKNLVINKKKVYRLCKELGIIRHRKSPKKNNP